MTYSLNKYLGLPKYSTPLAFRESRHLLTEHKRPPTTNRCGGLAKIYGRGELKLSVQALVMRATLHPTKKSICLTGSQSIFGGGEAYKVKMLRFQSSQLCIISSLFQQRNSLFAILSLAQLIKLARKALDVYGTCQAFASGRSVGGKYGGAEFCLLIKLRFTL